MNVLRELVSDKDNRLSHARVLNLLVGVCACLYCWKLVIVGDFTETYFAYLLLYGMGQQTVNKFLDLRSGKGPDGKATPPEA
jgi:hypothetical protein